MAEEIEGGWRQDLQETRQRTRGALLRLLDILAGLPDVAPEDLGRLRDAVQHLSGLFYLVVLGEFNSGKSAFINGLLGTPLMPEGVTPTTDKIHLLTHGLEAGSRVRQDDVVEWTFPADWLQGVYLVDTPGANSLFRQHENLARRFAHWADIVFFVMAANRAFAETDRLFLDLIREFRSKVVLIINQIDLLTGDDELERVRRYVSATFRQVAGSDVDVYAVSAKMAQAAGRAQGEEQMALWEQSGYEPVCRLVQEVLGEEERARQTILTSARLGLWAEERYESAVDAQMDAWGAELATLQNVWEQWDVYAREARSLQGQTQREMEETLERIQEMAQERLRADYGLGAVTRRLWRLALRLPLGALIRREEAEGGPAETGQLDRFLRVEAPEELEAVFRQHGAEIKRRGERLLASSLDHVTRQLANSRPEIRAKLIGKIEVPAEERRALDRLEESHRQVEEVLVNAGLPAFVHRWGAWARSAWWQTIAWEAAVIAGAWIASAYVRSFVEDTGRPLGWIAGIAVALFLLGLLILPARRMQARGQLGRAMELLGEQLEGRLVAFSESLVQRYRAALEAAMAPYRRVIESERDRLERAREDMANVQEELRGAVCKLAEETAP